MARSTFMFSSCPSVLNCAAVVGKKEGEGPLGDCFDIVENDTKFGQDTWEKAESTMQLMAVKKAIEKSGITANDVNIIFAGDLLNQSIGSTYGLRDLGIPFVGLYGACSTMAESLCLCSIFVANNVIDIGACVTSSHFCSAERQFRFPLEYGGQRTPTAQWTVTGSGSCVVSKCNKAPYIRGVTIGKIVDMGVTDINNMGGAMAPAAADTIKQFFDDTSLTPSDFDLILTGDLGYVGRELLLDILKKDGIDITTRHNDCGIMMFDRVKQDVHAGGSGCGCGASVLCGYVIPKMIKGELNNVLFIATGALMSPTSNQQGESIPGIAHLVYLSTQKEN